jgi:predicted dehydrogenase
MLTATAPDVGIFVEKPLATNYVEAMKVCNTARTSRVIHMVGLQKRYVATFKKAKEILVNGEIGKSLFFRSYSFSSDVFGRGQGWRFKKGSGGVSLDLGSHLLDLIIWYFGEPTRVAGLQKRIYSEEVEDYAHVNIEFESGLVGYADLCWSIRNYRLPEVYVEIHGTNGVLVVNDDYIKVQMDKDGKNLGAGNHFYRKPELQPSVTFLLGDPEFTLEDEEFRTAVQSKTLTEPNFFTAAKINLLMDKIHDLPMS